MTTVESLEHNWVNKLPEQLLSTDGNALLLYFRLIKYCKTISKLIKLSLKKK